VIVLEHESSRYWRSTSFGSPGLSLTPGQTIGKGGVRVAALHDLGHDIFDQHGFGRIGGDQLAPGLDRLFVVSSRRSRLAGQLERAVVVRIRGQDLLDDFITESGGAFIATNVFGMHNRGNVAGG